MKNHLFKTLVALLCSLPALFGTVSCDSDPVVPQDEIQHKHHEDPVKAVITLTKGKVNAEAQFSTLRLSQFTASEEVQTIAWALTADKGWQLESGSATAWEVKSMTTDPEAVYLLSINYYDAHNHLMNHEFIEEGQDKIHQHFFSWYENDVRVRNADRLPYEYVYADEDEAGQSLAETSPLGFNGFIRFRDHQEAFDLSIDLMHAAQSKFNAQGQPSPFYSPSAGQIGTALWDINLKVPVNVQRKADLSMFPSIASAELIFVEGHLHGALNFHENTYPTQIKHMGRRDTLRFTFDNESWTPDARNPKFLPLLTGHPNYAMVINYYNKAGELINGEFLEGNLSQEYQHFFTVSDIRPTFDGVTETTDANSPDFFAYQYCDTDPWNKTNKFGGARFVGAENPVGFKGFFQFHKARKTLVLNVKLMKTKASKLTGKSSDGTAIPSPWYFPTAEQRQSAAWFPTLQIPIVLFMEHSEKDLEEIDNLDEPTASESDFSEASLKTIRSMMNAYGISFEEAVAELYWNFNGARPPHSNDGFWF